MQIAIPPRFCGPPGFGNGGYVAGLLANALGGDAEISLAAPTPLDRALTLETDGANALLSDGPARIASAEKRALDLKTPPPATRVEARAAMTHYAGWKHHAFPNCFVCGPNRMEGDGLRIFAGPVDGRADCAAAIWKPTPDLADDTGAVRPEFLCAALDCPGYFAIQPEAGPSVLGRFHVSIVERPRAGAELIAQAWPMGGEGRRFTAGSAIFDSDGRCVARARAVWVRVREGGAFKVAAQS